MIRFLEDYLIKKINVAYMLNLHGNSVSKELLMEETGIPSTSLNRYISEIRNIYKSLVASEEEYSSYHFNKVINHIICSSENMNLLRVLSLYPGHNSDYYKKLLNISDASFYRRLAHVRNNLNELNCDISANKGYRIEGDNEINARFVLAHLASFFSWRLEETCVPCKQIFGKLDSKKLNYFDASNGEFERQFFEVFFAVSTIRDIQKFYVTDEKGAIIRSFDLNEYLINLYNKAETEINSKIDKYLSRLSESDLADAEKIDRFKYIFVKSRFHHLIFPYDSSEMPSRRVIFVDTFKKTVPKLYHKVDALIDQVFEDLELDFSSKKVSLIYLIVLESLFLFDEKSKQNLYVYSDYGTVHLNYLVDKLENLNQLFNNRLLVQPVYSLADLKLGKDDFIATNSFIKTIPEAKQFIVNDFFTLSTYVKRFENFMVF